jgi:hypothetical protein
MAMEARSTRDSVTKWDYHPRLCIAA